ncbi:hypothetical protein WME75_34465 [Sorangium sp. So ce1014]|uniref:hypothetical protein n=1 Tax=Sorangium sp. So ce1014 TaxID=3133326 RepID=UPI003F5E792A
MATSDRDDLVAQLRALDEQLAGVAPRPEIEARLRARLCAPEAGPARSALRGAWGLRRPIAVGLVAAAALAFGLDDGARSAVERWGVAARRLAAPADPIAGEPRADGGRAEPGPARPSVPPPPAPVAPAPAPRRRALPLDPRRRAEDAPLADIEGSPRAAPDRLPGPSRTPVQPRRGPALAPRDVGDLGPSSVGELPLFPVPRPEERGPGAAGRAGDEETARAGDEEGASTRDEKGASTRDEEGASTRDEEGAPREPAEALDTECTDAEALKERARGACEGALRELAEVDLRDACGDGLFRRVEYRCVEPAECISGTLGDGVACQDPNALIAQGTPICEEAGLVLRDLQFDKGDYEVCGGGVREATYLCCPPWPAPPPPEEPPPPPPPWDGPGCTAGLVGDGVTCEDPTALKDEAFAICQALGLPLRYFDAASMPCGAGALRAAYACCP